MGASDSEAREFAAAFRSFLEWVHTGGETRDEVAGLVTEFLGAEGSGRSVVTRSLPAFEHVNLQTALDAWSREPGREVVVQGLTLPPHYGGVTLPQLVSADARQPLRLSAAPLVDLPNGPGSTLACLRLGLLLVSDERGRYVVMVNGPTEHEPAIALEIAGLEVEAAQAVQHRLRGLHGGPRVSHGEIV